MLIIQSRSTLEFNFELCPFISILEKIKVITLTLPQWSCINIIHVSHNQNYEYLTSCWPCDKNLTVNDKNNSLSFVCSEFDWQYKILRGNIE